MRLIAHRGASATHPENTLAAFDAALAAGADGFECDLRLCADGVVVCHDADLRRFAGSSTPLLRRRSADLARCDIGTWKAARFHAQGVPDFTTLLDRYHGHCDLLLELKPPRDRQRSHAMVKAVTTALRQRGLTRCFLLCFDLDVLALAHRLLPQLPLVWNRGIPPRDLAAAKKLGVTTIDCRLDALTPANASDLRGHGFTVAAYSADTAAELAHAQACKVSIVMTNDPVRVRRLLTNEMSEVRGPRS